MKEGVGGGGNERRIVERIIVVQPLSTSLGGKREALEKEGENAQREECIQVAALERPSSACIHAHRLPCQHAGNRKIAVIVRGIGPHIMPERVLDRAVKACNHAKPVQAMGA